MIGNTQSKWWKNFSSSDAQQAEHFIHRDDTEVRNWYRTSKSKAGAAEAHLKVWIIRPTVDNPSALVGSANLTSQGLDKNIEIMVEATGSDLHSTIKTAEDCWREAWDCSERLLEYLSQSPSPLQSSTNPESRGSTSSTKKASVNLPNQVSDTNTPATQRGTRLGKERHGANYNRQLITQHGGNQQPSTHKRASANRSLHQTTQQIASQPTGRNIAKTVVFGFLVLILMLLGLFLIGSSMSACNPSEDAQSSNSGNAPSSPTNTENNGKQAATETYETTTLPEQQADLHAAAEADWVTAFAVLDVVVTLASEFAAVDGVVHYRAGPDRLNSAKPVTASGVAVKVVSRESLSSSEASVVAQRGDTPGSTTWAAAVRSGSSCAVAVLVPDLGALTAYGEPPTGECSAEAVRNDWDGRARSQPNLYTWTDKANKQPPDSVEQDELAERVLKTAVEVALELSDRAQDLTLANRQAFAELAPLELPDSDIEINVISANTDDASRWPRELSIYKPFDVSRFPNWGAAVWSPLGCRFAVITPEAEIWSTQTYSGAGSHWTHCYAGRATQNYELPQNDPQRLTWQQTNP